MERNENSQFNRGRCIARPKPHYTIIEDENEIAPGGLNEDNEVLSITANNDARYAENEAQKQIKPIKSQFNEHPIFYKMDT